MIASLKLPQPSVPDPPARAERLLGILLHRDGIVVDADDETASIFGCTREQIIGKLVADLVVLNAASGETTVIGPATAIASCGERMPLEIIRRRATT